MTEMNKQSYEEKNTELPFGEPIQFDMPKNKSSVIKVIGVGGGGNNAVNYMFNQGILGVDYVVCNTDAQALNNSPVPIKLQLGIKLTEGLGAGADPKVGEESALENTEEIKNLLAGNTKMVFVTAGMGGGTGTGAAPIVASVAKELNILTVGIVTIPFAFEGIKRMEQAEEGIQELRKYVDSLIVINNNKLREVYGNLGYKSGFAKADEVLLIAARGIAEVITRHFTQNIDLKDAETVLQNSGTAIMGSSSASGENRAKDAIVKALDSPLLNDNHIKGAKNVLLLIVSGQQEITVDEIAEINEYIQRESGGSANIIMGAGDDENLDDEINLTVIATGFEVEKNVDPIPKEPEKIVFTLEEEVESNKKIEKKEEEHLEKEIIENKETDNSEEALIEKETSNDELKADFNAAEEEIEEFVLQENLDVNLSLKNSEKENTSGFRNQQKNKEELNEWEQSLEKLVDDANDNPLPTQEDLKEEINSEILAKSLVIESRDESSIGTINSDRKKEDEIKFSLNKEKEKVNSKEIRENPVVEKQQNNRSEKLKEKLKSFNHKFSRGKDAITQLENQPAYERHGIELEDVPHSSESKISKYTLTESEGESPEIRPNNSFLHDNVD